MPPISLDLDALRAGTTAVVWARGQDYALRRTVTLVAKKADRIVARVEGSRTYRCVLSGESLQQMVCDCPAFADYPGPCKHLIATAMTLATQPDDDTLPPTAERIGQYLQKLTSKQLVQVILAHAEIDPDFEAQLLLKAETAAASPSGLRRVLQKAIDEAVATGDFVDYHEMDSWTRGIDNLLDQLETTADQGQQQAAVVADIIPTLLRRLEGAVEHTDDDGHIAMLLDRVVDLLAHAAIQAGPDPRAFGHTVATLDLESEYAEIGPPTGDLAKALGDEGLAAYWSVFEDKWEHIEPVRPSEQKVRHQPDYGPHDSWRVQQRLLVRARQSGDADGEIAILKKCLASANDYLSLATACHQHGRVDEALSWMDEGLWFFGKTDGRVLVDQGAAILVAGGQVDRALDLLWERFTNQPSFRAYERLQEIAASVDQSQTWREKSLGWLDGIRANEMADAKRLKTDRRPSATYAAQIMIDIHLASDELDQAWRIAKESDFPDHVWEQLAKASEDAFPVEAIATYRMLADHAVARGNKRDYQKGVEFVRKVKRLSHRHASGKEADGWMAALRSKYKAKRSFVAMLDQEIM